MSFFDSSTEYYGYSANLPLADVDDDILDQQLQRAILETALKRGQYDTQGEAIVRTLLTPSSINLNTAYYTRARQNPDYLLRTKLALPDSYSADNTIGLQWEAFFSAQEGGKAVRVTLLWDLFGAGNLGPGLYAYKKYGWNSYSGLCSNPPIDGYNILVDTAYDLLSNVCTFTFSNGSATKTKQIPGGWFTDVYDVSTKELVFRKIYCGFYEIISEPEAGKKYFHYDLNNDSYPELADLPEPTRVPVGSHLFMPGVTLIANGVAREESNFPEIYAHNKQYLSELGLDYQQLIDEVKESTEKSQVNDDVFVTLGIDVAGTSATEIHYLMEFFTWFRDNTACNQSKAAWDTAYAGNTPNPAVTVTFSNNDSTSYFNLNFDAFTQSIRVNYIERRVVDSVIGQVGEANRTLVDNQGKTDRNGLKYSKDYIIYRRQITPTQVEEIEVGGPVYRRSISVGKDIENSKSVAWSLSDQDDEGMTFVVPINIDLAANIPTEYANYLGFYAPHLTVDGFQKVKVKWYQKDEFKAFMAFVAVILAVYSGGQSIETFLALVEAYGVTIAVVITVVVGELVKLAAKELIDLLGRAFGEEFAMIFAVIVAVVLTIYGQFSKSPLISADKLLYLSNGLLQGASTYNAEQLAELQKENENRKTEAEKLQKDLEAMEKELNSGITLDAWTLGRIDPLWIPSETPTEYFTRTVHSGNIGALSIDAVSEFVTTKLTLPDLLQEESTQQWGTLNGMAV